MESNCPPVRCAAPGALSFIRRARRPISSPAWRSPWPMLYSDRLGPTEDTCGMEYLLLAVLLGLIPAIRFQRTVPR